MVLASLGLQPGRSWASWEELVFWVTRETRVGTQGDLGPGPGIGPPRAEGAHPPGLIGEQVQSLSAFWGLGTVTWWVRASEPALSGMQARSPGQRNRGRGLGRPL